MACGCSAELSWAANGFSDPPHPHGPESGKPWFRETKRVSNRIPDGALSDARLEKTNCEGPDGSSKNDNTGNQRITKARNLGIMKQGNGEIPKSGELRQSYTPTLAICAQSAKHP
jgi:hypothetical protein